MSLQLVSTVTVGSGGAASITLDNIPQTGKDLLILVSGRDESSLLAIQANNDSTNANYSRRVLEYNGSVTSSSASARSFAVVSGSFSTASTFGNTQIYISNYTSSANKSISVDGVNENNDAIAYRISLIAGSWNSASAITSLQLVSFGTGILQHSTFSLYIIS